MQISLSIVILVLFFAFMHKVPSGSELIIVRLGKAVAVKKQGIFFLVPFFNRVIEIKLRQAPILLQDIQITTSDNVPLKAAIEVQYSVADSLKAWKSSSNFAEAFIETIKSALKDSTPSYSLDDLLAGLGNLGDRVERILKTSGSHLGLKVEKVEVKYVTLPKELEEAMRRAALK